MNKISSHFRQSNHFCLGFPCFVYCGFGFWNFHRLFDSDKVLYEAVVEFRHVPFVEFSVHLFLVWFFPLVLSFC